MILSKDAALVLGLFFMVFELLMGAAIGLAAARLAYRSRFTAGLAVRAAALGGIAFVFAAILSGWAGAHSPALWLRMRLAENGFGFAVALVSACLAALLAGVKRPTAKD